MEAAVRFNINSLPGQTDQYFLKIDIAGRILQLYNITEERKSVLRYELVHASPKLSHFRAFDWHPAEAHLVAIGQVSGEASLVNLRSKSEPPISFNVRSPRSCNAVGLNTQNLLAAGLRKIRNDFCLNIWDLNQSTNNSSARGTNKGSEPLHKLAAGEPITSLRFFYDQPQLLAAGVEGQAIRLYDLRENTTSYALQFSTRCVNNISIDNKDENYFASCLISNNPTVSVWDRRMASRNTNLHMGFGSYISQADRQPEPSLELKTLIDPKEDIWGVRFSKTRRGQFGVLSNTGHLSLVDLGVAEISSNFDMSNAQVKSSNWDKQLSKDIFLENTRNIYRASKEHPQVDDERRVVSFDFTTDTSCSAEAKIITLTGDGIIKIARISRPASEYAISHDGIYLDRESIPATPELTSDSETRQVDVSEISLPRKFNRVAAKRVDRVEDHYLGLVRQRCLQGYLLDASKNSVIVQKNVKMSEFWKWLDYAKQISAAKSLVQNGIDFSYLGIFAIWMEEVNLRLRKTQDNSHNSNVHISTTIKELARRLSLTRGKGCASEYPQSRALCLHILGLPYNQDAVRHECERLTTSDDHTKAAAIALFAGEEKIAQQSLRAKGSGNSHKMLAMALLGTRNRHRRMRRSSYGSERSQDDGSEDAGSQDEEWKDIVTAVADDLSDCYARAILAYVKTGSWEDVVKQDCLPLRQRISIALRHFGDARLTQYLSNLKHVVIQQGDLEGIVVTGIGITEGVNLLSNYARRTNDLQTAALALSHEATSDRYLSADSLEMRIVYCYRQTYRQQLMQLRLKFEKTAFVVGLNHAIRASGIAQPPRPREQIRIVCTHCNSSIAQFGHDQQVAAQTADAAADAPRNMLTPEKAAVIGVVCPRCGRHLPRCGVCDYWIGVPDESYSKWFKPPPNVSSSQRNSNNMDLGASMAGSTLTAIGPLSESLAPSISITAAPSLQGSSGTGTKSKKISSTDLVPDPVEVVDEDLARHEKEKQWYEAMHKFIVFCTMCQHGFHAEHAKMWFDGMGGYPSHKTCPVPLCECRCNG